ncbi:WAT1-related protein, partial [Mucuna pruriens]
MVEMKGMWNVLHGLKPVMLMVLVQIAYTAVNVLYKLAFSDGMSVKVATAYRLAFGSAFTVPLALISERKKRPKMTWRVLFMAFLCGLFGGSLFQNLFYESLALTSATFASAIYNLIPAITFVLAISCGFERLNLRAAAGRAKVLGTIIGIGGAMLLTFFKGAEINIWPFHINLLHPHPHQNSHVAQLNADYGNKLLGALCAVASCFSFALWLTIQTPIVLPKMHQLDQQLAKMSKEYPCHYSSTALMSTAGAIQATAFGFCVERDLSQWKLGWNIRLLAVAYSGIVASGIVVIITAWCIQMRGPLFASVFNPLMLVLVAIAGSLMLNENLYVGSVVGAVLIVCGLYMVLWGKSKEMKNVTQLVPSETIQEAEAVEVVVMSMAVDYDKCDHDNQSERNVNKECDDLSKNKEQDDIRT